MAPSAPRALPDTPPWWLINLQIYVTSFFSPAGCSLDKRGWELSPGPDAWLGLPEWRKPLSASQRGCGANWVSREGTVASGLHVSQQQADCRGVMELGRHHVAWVRFRPALPSWGPE